MHQKVSLYYFLISFLNFPHSVDSFTIVPTLPCLSFRIVLQQPSHLDALCPGLSVNVRIIIIAIIYFQ